MVAADGYDDGYSISVVKEGNGEGAVEDKGGVDEYIEERGMMLLYKWYQH